jgi:hypothetical protein
MAWRSNFAVHGAASQASTFPSTQPPVSSQKPLQLGSRWRGKGGRSGIGLGGQENLTIAARTGANH